jgi:coenzyme F420-reducing hydrogenase beta subunit
MSIRAINNISQASIKFCTGCAACVSVCPQHALDYGMNDEEFFESFVLEDICTNCGFCKTVCIKYLPESLLGQELSNGILYSAQSNDCGIIHSCSSGGIAYEIARYGIGQGFSIVGVIYNCEANKAQTVVLNSLESLDILKGSKYLQADSNNAVQELVQDAKRDKHNKYIVFGTPCQIIGIKKLFEVHKIPNEIITIDLFCHGVPSYLVWKQYIQKYTDIQSVNFRNKNRGWHNFTIEIQTTKEKFCIPSDRDLFYQIFFDNILLNKACFNCQLRYGYSSADIRLGDFWGKKYQWNEDGISACLLMTDKGKFLFNKLSTKGFIKIIKKESISECMAYQSNRIYPYWNIRNYAFELLKSGEKLDNLLKKYRMLLPLKHRIRCILKYYLSYLPLVILLFMKRLMRNIGAE